MIRFAIESVEFVQSYLDHILDPGGRLCAHEQLSQSVRRTSKKPVTTTASEGEFRNKHAP
jgi:hypothetical protein